MGSPAPKRSPVIILRRRQTRKEPGGKACAAAGRLESEEGLRQPEEVVRPQVFRAAQGIEARLGQGVVHPVLGPGRAPGLEGLAEALPPLLEGQTDGGEELLDR